MMLLPIVERELRVAARRTATYRSRVLAAGLVACTAMVMLLFGSFVQAPSLVGGAMFQTLAALAFFFCAFEGVRKTADCLSEEKREGTLGLLFLTDLRGYDIIFGKLAAMSLNSAYSLLAILPMLALPLLMGGVTPGEYWRMVLALINLLFFSLCAGIGVSCRSRSEYQAMGMTFLLVVGVIVLPLLTFVDALFPISPAYAFHAAYESVYPMSAKGYWWSLGAMQIMGWGLLAWSSLAVTRSWREERNDAASSGWYRRRQLGDEAQRNELRTQLLAINPAYWLAGRNHGPVILLTLLVLGAAATSAVYFIKVGNGSNVSLWDVNSFLFPVMLLNLMFKGLLAAQACHCLAEARHNNALEMLLATPLTIKEIIAGQVLALKRSFLVPGIALLLLEVAGPFAGLVRTTDQAEWVGQFFAATMFGAVLTIFFALDVTAVTWTGMWFGLTSKKEGHAVAKTIVFVLLVPMFSLFLLCFGIPILFAVPVFWIIWSHQKLHAELRNIATHRNAAGPADSGWLPSIGSGRI